MDRLSKGESRSKPVFARFYVKIARRRKFWLVFRWKWPGSEIFGPFSRENGYKMCKLQSSLRTPRGCGNLFSCWQDCFALLAMTRCQQGLLRLCIPETWNLWFHSWSIPGRDNSSKGTSSQDSWGFVSLKLGISDSVVEVSLEETIRLKEAELPRLMGVGEHLAVCEKKFSLWKRNSRIEKKSSTLRKRYSHFEKIFNWEYLVEDCP